VKGGQDIYPDEKGIYHLFKDEDFTVSAAPLQHTVPCVGYVTEEHERPGRLLVENIRDLVEKNRESLKEMLNLRDGNMVYRVLKDLKPKESFKFPDGTVVNGEDINLPSRIGRKVVFLGDTCNSDMIVPIAHVS